MIEKAILAVLFLPVILLANNGIVLEEKSVYHIYDLDRATYEHKRKVFVLNDKGKSYADFMILENRYTELDDLLLVISDESGKKINKYDEDDLKESTIAEEISFYDDNKYLWIEDVYIPVPAYIELSYKIEYKSLFFWPFWYPENKDTTLFSQYKLIIDKPVKFNFFSKGFDFDPEINQDNGRKIYTWTITDIPPLTNQKWIAPEDKYSIFIKFAAEEFILDKSQGSFKTWNSTAQWFKQLSEGKYRLSNETIQEILTIASDKNDKQEIIKSLYKYLQQNTRYVSIDIGIGGWQPYPAESVFRKKYGDCKDLTTFMIAMLKIFDIEASPALILTSDRGIVHSNFPSNQFNHVITCVPLQSDTLWLECTADYIHAGDMPANIEGRNVLLLNEGQIVKTPSSSSDQNKFKSILTGKLSVNGDLKIFAKFELTGNQKINMLQRLKYNNWEDYKDWFRKRISRYSPLSKLNMISYCPVESAKSVLEIKFNGVYKNFAKITHKRIFINPNLFNRESDVDLAEIENQKKPIRFYYSWSEHDSVAIRLPRGYKVEGAPMDTVFDTPVGKYSIFYEVKNDTFFYSRKFDQLKKYITIENYPHYYKLIKAIARSDKCKFIFKQSADYLFR